ncbi:MAG: DNA translocase FtsK 4TM domain-containing protein [Rikenellaceae bacterium]|jgi:S-DNA-T family DNA segregation ATPase FtsK/SpoIIIE|nr:DNA translocase FtsK 4TM domain-containing protein [Rikenellaceae bacterium]
MATAGKKTVEKEQKRGLTENQRWVYGFVLLFFALFVLLAVASYYFSWANDQSLVRWGNLWQRGGGEVGNLAGRLGAVVAELIVAQGFGAFGLAIPVTLIVLSVRIMGLRPMFLRKWVRVTLIVMILGSVSLGLVFDDSWEIFGTGLGGAQGIFVAGWLRSYLGFLGVALLLVLSWVLLAVYLNRRTINTVNRVGRTIADRGAAVGKGAIDLINRREEDKQPERPKKRPAAEKPEPRPEPKPAREQPESQDDIAPWEERPVQPARQREEPQPPVKETFEIIDTTKLVETGTSQHEGLVVVETAQQEGVIEAGSIIDENDDLHRAEQEELLDDDDIMSRPYDPTLTLRSYQRPPVEILEDHSVEVVVTEEEVRENQNQIKRTLENFGIRIDKTKATVGPTVTLYEIVPAAGIRISRIKNLEDDIALSLSALGIRIIAPMPGKGTIGIEVPNKDKKIVSMYSVIKSPRFQEAAYELPVVLGKTIQNETFVIDLAKMPHLLVAGATGQGKSVGLNAILASLLYKKHPAEMKLVLVDPKKVELTLYEKLEKHFLARMEGEQESIITDTHKVINTLNSLCKEMDARYDLLRKAEVRNIKEYNEKYKSRRIHDPRVHRFLPYIIVVIDEFADMIMTAGREIETPIARLAQLARAVGIHLVIATQRPTTNIITGVIKANFPARVAFRVSSMIDSRTIIDQPGANQLIGRGDMLVSTGNDLVRVQCAFLDTPELERVMDFISRQRGYPEPYELPRFEADGGDGGKVVDLDQTDPMFDEVARFIVQNQQGSTSAVQRRFSIGYNRAGRIMDQIEAAGIVGKAEGSKPREVLISDMGSLEMLLSNY